ncbi:hypothetical protein AB1K89_16855 [Sporosarcina sp. 179-K 8C2 HS]|uniref:hypothetical protein n=1 Tax=Sporosarcina sp. 179-K 8C2 HS TaxID=3142387 RepID=UPI0039A3E783
MKKFGSSILSIMAAILISLTFTSNIASANQENGVEIQQSTKWIPEHVVSTGSNIPPAYYYYSAGGYHGWLSRQYVGGTKGDYYGVYAGTVYINDGTPIPTPFSAPDEDAE